MCFVEQSDNYVLLKKIIAVPWKKSFEAISSIFQFFTNRNNFKIICIHIYTKSFVTTVFLVRLFSSVIKAAV